MENLCIIVKVAAEQRLLKTILKTLKKLLTVIRNLGKIVKLLHSNEDKFFEN
jgi:hypothetical protein